MANRLPVLRQGTITDAFSGEKQARGICKRRLAAHQESPGKSHGDDSVSGAAAPGAAEVVDLTAAEGSKDAPVDLTVEGSKDVPVDLTVPLYPKRRPSLEHVGENRRLTSEDPGETVFMPTGTHTHTVVLLHGMYCPPDTCPTFAALPEYVERLGMDGVKFVYPHAPRRTISWPTGPEPNVASWYNYFTRRDGWECHDELDETHLASQTSRLHGILEREAALLGGDARRVILGGSSQGGTVALHAAISFSRPLGALLCLRSCLVDTVSVPRRSAAHKTPVFVFAAGNDTVYNPVLQRRGYEKLQAAGFCVEWHVEPNLQHWSETRTELLYTGAWIVRAARGLELRPLELRRFNSRERAASPTFT